MIRCAAGDVGEGLIVTPSEFLNLLNELRSERDLAMECVELGKEQEDQLKHQLLAQGNKVIAQAEEISVRGPLTT